MQPFYYTVSTNFGDHMNSWLWPELIPDMLEREDDMRLVGVGSLLSRNLDLVPGRKVIFGTGSGYSSPPSPEQAKAWRIYCVRGPLTAGLMGLDPALAVTDGAWLINRIPRYAALPTDRRGTVFVPHWTSAKFGNWAQVCAAADVGYIDPLWDCDRVCSRTSRSAGAGAGGNRCTARSSRITTAHRGSRSSRPAGSSGSSGSTGAGSLGLEYAPLPAAAVPTMSIA